MPVVDIDLKEPWFWWKRKRPRPKPPKPLPRSFWQSRGTWVAWGLENGSFDTVRLVRIAKARGCSWVGIQDTPYNRPKRDALRASLNAEGMKLVVWEWAVATDWTVNMLRYWKPDAYAANVEHRGKWDVFCREVRAAFPGLPMAVWTNFAGAGAMPDGSYSKEEAGWFWKNGFSIITESYMVNEQGPQPSLSPDRLEWTARTQLGYTDVHHSFGIYRCPPSFYDEWVKTYPNHSWYLTEYLPEV